MQEDVANETYEKQCDKITRLLHKQERQLEAKYRPNENSAFLTQYDCLPKLGGIMFATLYTSGVLTCSHEQYKQLWSKYYVTDCIENTNTLLAFTEYCPNAIGIRCFFEFDYRSYIRLPTQDELIKHVQIAQNLIRESFPNNTTNIDVYAAKCSPKLKYSRQDKLAKPKLAVGLHLVFPYIVVHTAELRQLILTLDARITQDNPFFSGIVDPSSVKRECASLRPLYAYRLDNCESCITSRKTKSKTDKKLKFMKTEEEWSGQNMYMAEKEDRDSDDSDMELDELLPLDESVTCRSSICLRGRKIASPSIYIPWLHINNQGIENLVEKHPGGEVKKKWLELTSIVPDLLFPRSNYVPVQDAVASDSILTTASNSIIFIKEKKINNQILRNNNDIKLSPQTHTEIYSLITKLIREFDEHYERALINVLHFNSKYNSMYATLKGDRKITNWCFLKEGPHQGNGVFFTFQLKPTRTLKTSEMKLGCHDSDCKALYKLYKDEKKKQTKTKAIQATTLKPGQQLLLARTSKLIPTDIRKQILCLLRIHDTYIERCGLEEDISKEYKDNNEYKKDENLVFDERTGTMVYEQELSMPVPTKKRSYNDLVSMSDTSDQSSHDSLKENRNIENTKKSQQNKENQIKNQVNMELENSLMEQENWDTFDALLASCN